MVQDIARSPKQRPHRRVPQPIPLFRTGAWGSHRGRSCSTRGGAKWPEWSAIQANARRAGNRILLWATSVPGADSMNVSAEIGLGQG